MLCTKNISDLEDKVLLTKDIHLSENVTMDLLESGFDSPTNSTTVPVKYSDHGAIHKSESACDIFPSIFHHEICTADENRNNLLKSADSEGTWQHSKRNELDCSQQVEHSTGASSFRLSIPAIKEAKESGSDEGGYDSSSPATSPRASPSVKASSKHPTDKTMLASERRSSLPGVPGGGRRDQRPRRRFSISISSSDESSSDSEAEKQAEIEQYLQSGQRRRHTIATTSNELAQAMSALMTRRSSGSSLFPLLARSPTNFVNSCSLNSITSESNFSPCRQRNNPKCAPIIQVSEDTDCCHKLGCPISPINPLSRPHSPVSGSLLMSKSNESIDLSECDTQLLNTENEVIRILTTRSPAISEDDDSESEVQEKLPRRSKHKYSRRLTRGCNLPETRSLSRRSSIADDIPTQRANKSRRSSLSVTPPSPGAQSIKSSMNFLEVPCDQYTILAQDLNQRLENLHLQSPDEQKTTKPNTTPPEELTFKISDRRNRRASMCIPSAHHPTAYLAVSKEEDEEIRLKANQKGKRRSSWACAGAPPPLIGHIRAMSPVTLLRESNYYGDELADDKKYQDPYYLTIHFITNPRKSRKLKKLLKPLTDSIAPKLKLFNYVERSEKMPKKRQMSREEKLTTVPASGVVLFLNEGFGMERILEVQKYLSEKAEWRVHHSDKVGSNAVPYPTNNQDFYAHCEDMPLWAVRQVHFGRDRLRFQIFVSNDNWQDTIAFYSTVLARDFQYQKDDFCYFLVFASRELNLEVQLAFKKLPLGFMPRLLESTILQFKVENIEGLVPLLPNVCSPISDKRWQTMDPDGNTIVLFKTSNGDFTPGVFSTPQTTSTTSSDNSTEISDGESGTPEVSPRPVSPKLPRFVDTIHRLDEEKDPVSTV